MTSQERQALAALIVATSAYYGQMLADNVISMYVEDLSDLPFEKIIEAFKKSRRDPKTTRCPLPAVIRGMLDPSSNVEDAARDASSRIIAAVSKYGWNNFEQARTYIGELGWEVVKRHGGWQTLCESLTYSNMGMLQAQWRELAASIQRSGATQSSGPALPPPSGPNNLLSFMRDIPK